MKVDEVIKSAISRAAVVRVQNALNPLLWILAISVPICWVAAYVFRDDPLLKYSFSALGALPIIGSIVAYFLYFFLDRDRLQSEEFILKQRELSIIERKGKPPMPLDIDVTEDTQLIDVDAKDKKLGGDLP
jgi:hypothetical protein